MVDLKQQFDSNFPVALLIFGLAVSVSSFKSLQKLPYEQEPRLQKFSFVAPHSPPEQGPQPKFYKGRASAN